jgi:integrase
MADEAIIGTMDDECKRLWEALTTKGFAKSTIRITIATFRHVSARIADWEKVTSMELHTLASNGTHIDNLKRALRSLYPDSETRWPGFFVRKNTDPKCLMFKDTLEMRDEGVITSTHYDIVHLIMQGKLEKLSRPFPQWVEHYLDTTMNKIPDTLRLRVVLRWGITDGPILNLFRLICEFASAQLDRRPRYYFILIDTFYEICKTLQPSGLLLARLIALSREEFITHVSGLSITVKFRAPALVYQFTQQGPWVKLFPHWRTWAPVTHRDVGYQGTKRKRDRNCFTEDELNLLFDAVKHNTWENALLRFYIHTGCRLSAACELKVDDVWDEKQGCCKPSGVVLEKSGKRFRFPIDSILGEALTALLCDKMRTNSEYVFSVQRRTTMVSDATIVYWLKRVCKRIPPPNTIKGNHIHVHALRHTVCTLLDKYGNSIDSISSFIGHATIEQTRHYIDRTVSRPENRMDIPWLPTNRAGARPTAATVPLSVPRGGAMGRSLPGNSSSSSSSSSKSSSTDSMIDMLAGDPQVKRNLLSIIEGMKKQKDELEARLLQNTNEYNFITNELLTGVQRTQLFQWQMANEVVTPAKDPPTVDQGDVLNSIVLSYNLHKEAGHFDEEDDDDDQMDEDEASESEEGEGHVTDTETDDQND